MRENIKTFGKNEWYLLFYACFAFAKASGYLMGDVEYYVLAIVGGVFWIIAMLNTKYDARELGVVGMLIVLGCMSTYNSRKIGALLPIMVIIGAKEVSIEYIVGKIINIEIAAIAIHIILTAVGVYDNSKWSHYRFMLGSGISRFDLGYGHPNATYQVFFGLMLLVIYKKKINKKRLLGAWICNVVLYGITKSNAGLLMTSVALVIFWLINKETISKYSVVRIMKYLSVLAIAITFLGIPIAAQIGSEGCNVIARVDSGRLWWNYRFLITHPLTLFGQPYNGIVDYTGGVDNVYIFMMIRYGILYLLFFLICYFLTLQNINRNKNVEKFVICCLFLIYGYAEGFVCNPFMNWSFLFVGEEFWKRLQNTKWRVTTLTE